MKKILLIIFLIVFIVSLFNIYKKLPDGISLEGEIYKIPDSSIKFLSDKTYFDEDMGQVYEQEIFDEIFLMISNAENFILIDMFLFNNFKGRETESYIELSKKLTDTIVNKKIKNPEIKITFISDPLNQIYGSIESENIKKLKENEINFIEIDLKKLRDSNPIYSGMWRLALQYLPVNFIKLPNPFDSNSEKVGLDSYLTLLNFKANHRKVIVADYKNNLDVLKVSSLITSANPHDGSSGHSNVAIKIDDFIWKDLLKSEYSVINFSGGKIDLVQENLYDDSIGNVSVQLLTEKKIKDSIVNSINETKKDDSIKMVMFYISERDIIESIKKADERGVDIEVILDPNKDAFGRLKGGVPNVSVAREFKKLSEDFKLRWCNTHGEQCHSKLLIIEKENISEMFLGSANFTKRNLGNYNLETNVKLSGSNVTAINDAKYYFNDLWSNEQKKYTVDYDFYKDESLFKYIKYRVMEKTGMSSF